MSYWSGYDDQLNGGFPICNPEYVPYYNNMPYFSDPTRPNYGVVNSGYNFYDAQPSYQNNYLEQPGTSQVTNNFAPNVAGDDAGTSQNDVNKNSGTVKKKSNERNRYWNNGRKNESYGSGRTFNRSKPEPRKAEVDEGNGDDVREAKSKNKQGQKQDGKNYYQYNRYRNSYDDRRSNYRGRDNRFDGYDNRGYGKYGKQSSKNYDGGDYGANGRDESARDKNNWRSSNCNRKCNSSNVRKKCKCFFFNFYENTKDCFQWTPPLSESVWSRCFHGACSSASSAARKSNIRTRSGLVNNATTSST
jgi:hypothetical protein